MYTTSHTRIARLFYCAAIVAGTLTASTVAQNEQANVQHFMQGGNLAREQVLVLEASLEDEPENFVIRTKLLGYYGRARFQSSEARTEYTSHALWIITNRPESQIAGRNANLNKHIQPEAFEKAAKIWAVHLDRDPENISILGNMASFYTHADRARAIELLKRARDLDQENPEWPNRIGHMYELDLDFDGEIDLEVARKSLEAYEEALRKTKDNMKRYYMLAAISKAAIFACKYETARRYATELLDSAVGGRSDWNYGNAIHAGNNTLGRIALIEGNLKEAEKFLIRAGKTPGSPQLNSFGPNMLLAKELLEAGSKEAVIEYLELCGKFWKQNQADQWISDIKEGRMPNFGGNLRY